MQFVLKMSKALHGYHPWNQWMDNYGLQWQQLQKMLICNLIQNSSISGWKLNMRWINYNPISIKLYSVGLYSKINWKWLPVFASHLLLSTQIALADPTGQLHLDSSHINLCIFFQCLEMNQALIKRISSATFTLDSLSALSAFGPLAGFIQNECLTHTMPHHTHTHTRSLPPALNMDRNVCTFLTAWLLGNRN